MIFVHETCGGNVIHIDEHGQHRCYMISIHEICEENVIHIDEHEQELNLKYPDPKSGDLSIRPHAL